MVQSFTGKKRIRKSFGRIPEAVTMPNLIEVQRSSYEQFLQREVRPAQRRDEGIEAVFKSVFPIKDFNERAVLEYVSYEFEDPKYDMEECIQRDMTYAAPLKVKLRLIVFESDEETGARSVKYIKAGGKATLTRKAAKSAKLKLVKFFVNAGALKGVLNKEADGALAILEKRLMRPSGNAPASSASTPDLSA